MRWPRWWVGCLAIAACAAASRAQAAALVPESQAVRCGLTRAWFAQVGSLQSTGPVSHVHYDEGVLLVQTVAGMLSGLDAETGRTLWATQIGPRGRQTSEASANKDYVAAINGSTLYVLDRHSGTVLWQRRLGGAPGAGTAVSATHVFVPMIDGRMEGFALDGGTKFDPWIYKSAGRMLTTPMATPQSISWTTEQGYFYVADPSGGGVRYRLETNDAIHARPGYWTPNLYAGSSDGFVYAVDEVAGTLNWKFSLGDAVYQPPVAINDKVFVVSQFLGMTCLDAQRGYELWVAPGIRQFLSASPTRLYACDAVGRLVVLDLATGSRLASMPLGDVAVKLTNPHTDRIYLVGATGAVQCLREVGQKTPVAYNAPPPPKKEAVKLRVRDRGPKAAGEPTEETPPEEPADKSAAPPAEPEKPEAPAGLESDDPFATP